MLSHLFDSIIDNTCTVYIYIYIMFSQRRIGKARLHIYFEYQLRVILVSLSQTRRTKIVTNYA